MEKPPAGDGHLLGVEDAAETVGVGDDVGKDVEVDQMARQKQPKKAAFCGGDPGPQGFELVVQHVAGASRAAGAADLRKERENHRTSYHNFSHPVNSGAERVLSPEAGERAFCRSSGTKGGGEASFCAPDTRRESRIEWKRVARRGRVWYNQEKDKVSGGRWRRIPGSAPQKMSGEIREKTDFSLKRGAGIRYNIKNAFLRGGGSAVSKTMIRRVEPRSPAAKAGVQAGETLAEISRKQILDVLDYKFYSYDARLTLTLQAPDGASRTLRVRKEEGGTWD